MISGSGRTWADFLNVGLLGYKKLQETAIAI